MDVDNLSQFNSNEFFRLLGFYVLRCRTVLKLSIEQLANETQISPLTIEQIEIGRHRLANNELRRLITALSLDESEILNIAKITQVQSIIDVSRELNANFPQ